MSEKIEIILVLPDSIGSMSLGATKLCELFVWGVLSSPIEDIFVSVDHHDRHILINDHGLEDLFVALLGSGKLSDFYRQLRDFSFPCEAEGSFLLKAIIGQVLHIVMIKEIAPPPNLKLHVTKGKNELA